MSDINGIGVQRDTGSEFKIPVSCGTHPAAGTQYTFTIPGCTAPPSDMIGWWPAEGNAHDIVSHNNGSLNGATFSAGEVNQSFSFDGADDYVLVSDSPSLHYTDFTYDAWIAPAADTAYTMPMIASCGMRVSRCTRVSAKIAAPTIVNPSDQK